jgi:hypothetical protein
MIFVLVFFQKRWDLSALVFGLVFNYESLQGQDILVCISVPCVEKNHSGSTTLLFAITTLLYLYFLVHSAKTIEK